MNLHESFQFATATFFLVLVGAAFLVGIWLVRRARKLEQDIKAKVDMVRVQVRQLHKGEYTQDSWGQNQQKSFDSNSPLLIIYDSLATRCDEIYHPDGSWPGMSDDRRIQVDIDESSGCLTITIRGTQDLQDVLWDLNIVGISPVEDLNDASMLLLQDLISACGARTTAADVLERLTTWLCWDPVQTMEFSTGAWTLAKQVLRHMVTLVQTAPSSPSALERYKIIFTGHSLGGGAAFLAAVVLSCVFDNDDITKPTKPTRIACVTFGQPRVLVIPRTADAATNSTQWLNTKKTIMTYLNTVLAKNGMTYHRIVVDADPIPLIPTRVPRALGTATEKFVHVPNAVVIEQVDNKLGAVRVTTKSSSYTEVVSNDYVLKFLRSLATTLLMASHKMEHYRELLRVVMDTADNSGANDESLCYDTLFEETSTTQADAMQVVVHKYKF